MNATNEKGLLDVLTDSLNYVDGNKEKHPSVPNVPSYNVSDDDENTFGGDDDDDEDEEEISLLDYFLKGDSSFTSTTEKPPFVFNVTGKPLLNGMTNSPMQIQPILPENMKNESIKFSMLPVSLYNMVKEDGTVMFDGDRSNETPQIVSSNPLGVTEIRHPLTEMESGPSSVKSEIIQTSTINHSVFKTTTQLPKQTTTIQSSTEVTTAKVKPTQTSATVRVSNQTTKKVNKPENISVKNETESTTKKPMETTTMKMKITSEFNVRPNPTVVHHKNLTTVHSLSTEKIISTTPTTRPTTTRITTTKTTTTTAKSTTKMPVSTPKITTSTQKTTTTTMKPTTTSPLQPLTTKATTMFPKITAVQINSNPSILEADINYDYSEPTLPPSLPNLKIIPFLPTDALSVKNIIHRNDNYKPNYNYYQSGSSSYVRPEAHVESAAYSPFNGKPNIEKYPSYNVADDRIDYDSYKMPAENVDGLDYINVYANAGANSNLAQPSTFSLSVNSKLDYGTTDQKVVPSKITPTTNKNLTVKPPLPPFEPEYNLYNLPPRPQIELGNNYNEYNVNSPISSDPFPSEHNYNVPHFVTMPPLKEPTRKPVGNKDTIFSYGLKNNKFIPPAKTEGTYFKRTF